MRSSYLFTAAFLAFCGGPAVGQESAEPQPAAPAQETAAAETTPGALTLELNKLVAAENVCQAYFVVDNQTPDTLQELTVDAYLFDAEGVILRGLALQFMDVRAGRATVVPFELPDLPCGDISRILLNKVLTCTSAAGTPVTGCADKLAVSTRTEIAFDY